MGVKYRIICAAMGEGQNKALVKRYGQESKERGD